MLTPQTRYPQPDSDQFVQQTTSLQDGVQIISAAGEMFNHVDDNLPMWSGDGDRQVDVPVRFAAPFKRPPHITLGVTGIDASHAQNLRYQLEAVDVTHTSFVLRIRTWGDTRIARASASWSALGMGVPMAQRPKTAKAPAVKEVATVKLRLPVKPENVETLQVDQAGTPLKTALQAPQTPKS